VQKDIPLNNSGWHDPQARFLVLNEDVGPTLAGTRPAEPLFFRVNSGECVNAYPTNLIPDVLQADDFQVFTLLYRTQTGFRFPEGMWGIMRVTP
jgi:manganese oxidase